KYGNSVTADLWSAVQAASGQPVMDIAQGFTSQPGYPIVRATGGACNAQGSGGETIAPPQKRLALDDSAPPDALLSMPMVAQRLGGQTVRSVVPARAQASISLPGCGGYILNAGRSAYFRVLYDQANLQALEQNFTQLSADDQLGTLLDYWAFARSGD